jgi:hypothetical protein
MDTSVTLVGGSSATYSYEVAAIDAAWQDVPGNYAFAAKTELDDWCILYVGEVSSLRDGFADHPLWPEAVSSGCAYVLAHANEDGVQSRQLEMHDLLEGLKPLLNRKHRD